MRNTLSTLKANRALRIACAWLLASLCTAVWAPAAYAAGGRPGERRAQAARQAAAVELRSSVVVLARTNDRRGSARQEPSLASQLAVPGEDWRDSGVALWLPSAVRCDLCVATAASSRPGVPSIAHFDLRTITNRLTTLQIRDTTFKVTSLSPLWLSVRKPF